MLQKKLEKLDLFQGLWTLKGPEKIIEGLSKIINLMRDLMQLAKNHGIENKLYLGDAIERITALLGEQRLHRWLSLSCDKELSEGEGQWEELILFLEKEVKINQQRLLLTSKKPKPSPPPSDSKGNNNKDKDRRLNQSHHTHDEHSNSSCHICGKNDHVATSGPRGKLVQYFACPKFAKDTCEERLNVLKTKGFCYQCLFPGAHTDRGKHKEDKCQRKFICKHPSHSAETVKRHVLVCSDHKLEAENKKTLKDYVTRCISKKQELHDFSKNISIHHHSYICSEPEKQSQEEPDDGDAIYMLQTICVDGKTYNILYDTGCRRFAIRHNAVCKLGNRAREMIKGPTTLGGVMGMTAQSPYGIYRVRLPVEGRKDGYLTGACMDVITEKFPTYPLHAIYNDISSAYIQAGGKAEDLPRLPSIVGGETDLMIGMKYQRYIPEKIFQLPSGLAIYKSHFKNVDGTFGVCGGPHPIIAAIDQQHCRDGHNFISQQFHIFKTGYQVDIDVDMLGFNNRQKFIQLEVDQHDDPADTFLPMTDDHCIHCVYAVQGRLRKFNEVEEAGSEITYRCIKCRMCKECKNHDASEAMSIREEVEDHIIKRSISVDTQTQVVTAKLPLIANPATRLKPNASIAKKVYDSMIKKLNKNPQDKASVIKAEKKLHDNGFVAYVKDLPEEIQEFLWSTDVQNFLPWRVVFKSSSITTPCCPVFDASMPTASGFSLNDLLVKGRNSMNKMVEIFIRWRSHMTAYHNDINTMYNQVKLEHSYWSMQRYWWHETLDPDEPPVDKVIKTLIYGCKSSGNQAEHAIRLTASLFKEDFPEINEIVHKDLYVDDCMSGESSLDPCISSHSIVDERTGDLEFILNRGGFTLKSFTVSGRPPDASVTKDGVSIGVAGHRWFSEEDAIGLDVSEPNFATKKRGKFEGEMKEVPKKLKRVPAALR